MCGETEQLWNITWSFKRKKVRTSNYKFSEKWEEIMFNREFCRQNSTWMQHAK